MTAQSTGATLRALLNRDGMVVAPGAYDGITATFIKAAGFDAIYMTGSGTSAALGYPDYGLATMTEMVANASRIATASGLPLIADGDTGFGNELNVTRAVREYERHGVSAIHLEDQSFPKKCGHLDDKVVIPQEEYFAKIRAAASARRSPDFLIIARTDARAVNGFDDAIARSNGALANGADVVFFEAAQTVEEVAKVPQLVNGPCLLNIVHKGKTPKVELKDAEAMGYKIAILPSLLLRHIFGACEEMLEKVKTGPLPTPTGDLSPIQGFAKFGSEEWDALRTRFRDVPHRNAAE
ncbi:MAG TPA: isocitrate lyase/PEP mutase family protein [Hyphomicrobiaceae bacterium]|nr:isocitrate lyase/PEP mutase family protein [Hyphomicrobiaceae bacterium]